MDKAWDGYACRLSVHEQFVIPIPEVTGVISAMFCPRLTVYSGCGPGKKEMLSALEVLNNLR